MFRVDPEQHRPEQIQSKDQRLIQIQVELRTIENIGIFE